MDLERGRIKDYDGKIVLWAPTDWLVLLNAKGAPIMGKYLNPSDPSTLDL
jgi:hypothetical protein